MRKPVLTIFYQFNPWQSSIGGIQTIIRTFIKYAPSEFEVRLVGTGAPGEPIGVWQEREFAGRPIQFTSAIAVAEDNVRKIIPTTIKYGIGLLGRNFSSDFMHFHRLEPSIAALNWPGDKTLFVHNDIRQQMDASQGNNAILWQRFPAAYFALERFLIDRFDRIYSCNSESVAYYQNRYPAIADRVAFLKNAVDTETFSALSETKRQEKRQQWAREMGLAPETQLLLFAGRLHPQKDPLLLLRAFATLDRENVHLAIAGEGELKSAMNAEIAKLGIGDRVTLLGSVPQARLASLHQVASAFVLSSAYEGLPVVVLEALSCGTPVVTTATGETPRILSSDSGVVCKARTPEAIAEGLRRVLCHPEEYPASACVRTAQPYAASTAVREVYAEMLHRWEQRCVSSGTPKYV